MSELHRLITEREPRLKDLERERTVHWQPVVTLTDDEVLHAASIGVLRRLKAIARKRSEPYGSPPDPWEVDIESAAAEYAVAEAMQLPWRYEVVDNIADAPCDVGDDVQVRWTKYATGHLTVYPADKDAHRFVLVTGRIPSLTLRGWLYGAEAKTLGERGVDPRGNAIWVDAIHLRSFERLPRMESRRKNAY